jgi:hypothetical protein
MMEIYNGVVSTVIARGLEERNEPGKDNVPGWRVVIMPITLVAFVITWLAVGLAPSSSTVTDGTQVDYTYGEVVKTLTIIESSTAVLFEPIPMEDIETLEHKPDDEPSIETQLPITRTLRTTIAHLRSRAGPWSYFRGLSIYIFCEVLFVCIVSLITTLHFIPYVVAAFIAQVLLSTFRMGWTWVVISEPSSKLWFRRLPSIKLWTTVAIPTALAAIFEVVARATPIYVIVLFDLVNKNTLDLSKAGDRSQLLAAVNF